VRDEILSYREMCDREGMQTLQRGMNYRLRSGYSVVLMSRRPNAPYRDRILEDEETIEYEGHNLPRASTADPKNVDQPRLHPSGKLTQNGLFAECVDRFRNGERGPESVRVYEKVFQGVWSDKGLFELIDYRIEWDGRRNVFKFYLKAVGKEAPGAEAANALAQRRLIPAEVKKEVWVRDGGKCQLCGATDNLHFDHDIPFSKGGSSIAAENVRILCARHNIQKSDKIE
jgi:hypothetical protein